MHVRACLGTIWKRKQVNSQQIKAICTLQSGISEAQYALCKKRRAKCNTQYDLCSVQNTEYNVQSMWCEGRLAQCSVQCAKCLVQQMTTSVLIANYRVQRSDHKWHCVSNIEVQTSQLHMQSTVCKCPVATRNVQNTKSQHQYFLYYNEKYHVAKWSVQCAT